MVRIVAIPIALGKAGLVHIHVALRLHILVSRLHRIDHRLGTLLTESIDAARRNLDTKQVMQQRLHHLMRLAILSTQHGHMRCQSFSIATAIDNGIIPTTSQRSTLLALATVKPSMPGSDSSVSIQSQACHNPWGKLLVVLGGI